MRFVVLEVEDDDFEVRVWAVDADDRVAALSKVERESGSPFGKFYVLGTGPRALFVVKRAAEGEGDL